MEITEKPTEEAKLTLSDRLFLSIGEKLEQSERGRKIAEHIKGHARWYREGYSIAIIILVVVFIRLFVLTAFYIPSPSMENTLMINDRVFVFRLIYLFSEPAVGDIVVFRVPETIPNYEPEKPIWIKRIVGVAGDRVSIRNGRLAINGELVSEPPIFRRNKYSQRLRTYSEEWFHPGDEFKETSVEDGHVLVFGDNSNDSYDGRYWGPIPEDRIIGKAFLRFWPLSRVGPLHGESKNPLPPGQ